MMGLLYHSPIPIVKSNSYHAPESRRGFNLIHGAAVPARVNAHFNYPLDFVANTHPPLIFESGFNQQLLTVAVPVLAVDTGGHD